MSYSDEDFARESAWTNWEVPEGADPALHHARSLQAQAILAAAKHLDIQGGCEDCVDAARNLGLNWAGGTVF